MTQQVKTSRVASNPEEHKFQPGCSSNLALQSCAWGGSGRGPNSCALSPTREIQTEFLLPCFGVATVALQESVNTFKISVSLSLPSK